ncbi:MAG: hypothetical protein R3C03_03305 [Pirellulaceae bacterium]
MATLAFIRGWINASSDLSDKIRALISKSIDDEGDDLGDESFRNSLKQCWHFPSETGPGSHFVLLGASVKAFLLPLFKAQLTAIARDIVDDDNGVEYTLSGRFEISVEGQSEDQQWTISDGILDTSRRLPYLLSP